MNDTITLEYTNLFAQHMRITTIFSTRVARAAMTVQESLFQILISPTHQYLHKIEDESRGIDSILLYFRT